MLFKAYLPERVQQGAETAVGILIVGLAVWLLVRWRRGLFHVHLHAHDRLHAAKALAADGRRAEADVQLRRALAFYRSVGATRYVREGEALLAAAS